MDLIKSILTKDNNYINQKGVHLYKRLLIICNYNYNIINHFTVLYVLWQLLTTISYCAFQTTFLHLILNLATVKVKWKDLTYHLNASKCHLVFLKCLPPLYWLFYIPFVRKPNAFAFKGYNAPPKIRYIKNHSNL